MKPVPRLDFSAAFREWKWEASSEGRDYYDAIWMIILNDMQDVALVPEIPGRREAWPPQPYDPARSIREARLDVVARSSYAIVADDHEAGKVERLPDWNGPEDGSRISGTVVFFVTTLEYSRFAGEAEAALEAGGNARGSAASWISRASLSLVRFIRNVILESEYARYDRDQWIAGPPTAEIVLALTCPRCAGHRIVESATALHRFDCTNCGLGESAASAEGDVAARWRTIR